MKRRRGRPADLYPTFPWHLSTLHTPLLLHRFIPLLSIFIFTLALMSCNSLCIPLLPLSPCHGIFYFFPLLQPLLHAVSPSALSLHSHSSALFTFHLFALTRLSAVLSLCCRGDAFTSPIVIESYEYFSPIVQLSTTSSPVIYLSARHHDPFLSLPSSVFSLTPSPHQPFSSTSCWLTFPIFHPYAFLYYFFLYLPAPLLLFYSHIVLSCFIVSLS